MAGRTVPPGWLQADILIAQHNACIYCGHDFGDPVYTKTGDVYCWRELEWEHFVPYSYLLSNPDDNWLAACNVCNGFKSDFIFKSVDEVRHHVLERYVAKRYKPLPITIDYDDGDWTGWTPRENYESNFDLAATSKLKVNATVEKKIILFCQWCGKQLTSTRYYCTTNCAANHSTAKRKAKRTRDLRDRIKPSRKERLWRL